MQAKEPDPVIRSKKQMVYFSDELNDSEAVAAFELVARISAKYARKDATVENLDALRDECLTRLAESMNILAEIDISPIYSGEGPIVEFKGKFTGDDIHQYGFDHEKKKWEIDKAHDRGEDYLGEKESSKSRKGQ
jgi:hypothetical protein